MRSKVEEPRGRPGDWPGLGTEAEDGDLVPRGRLRGLEADKRAQRWAKGPKGLEANRGREPG